jgi:hypothetical protein
MKLNLSIKHNIKWLIGKNSIEKKTESIELTCQTRNPGCETKITF